MLKLQLSFAFMPKWIYYAWNPVKGWNLCRYSLPGPNRHQLMLLGMRGRAFLQLIIISFIGLSLCTLCACCSVMSFDYHRYTYARTQNREIESAKNCKTQCNIFDCYFLWSWEQKAVWLHRSFFPLWSFEQREPLQIIIHSRWCLLSRYLMIVLSLNHSWSAIMI